MVLITVDQRCCESKTRFSIGINIFYHIIQSDSVAVQPILLRSVHHSKGVMMWIIYPIRLAWLPHLERDNTECCPVMVTAKKSKINFPHWIGMVAFSHRSFSHATSCMPTFTFDNNDLRTGFPQLQVLAQLKGSVYWYSGVLGVLFLEPK